MVTVNICEDSLERPSAAERLHRNREAASKRARKPASVLAKPGTTDVTE
jgi:hypothetical protein